LIHVSQFEIKIHTHGLADCENEVRLNKLPETGPRRSNHITAGLQKLEFVDALLVAGGFSAGALVQVAQGQNGVWYDSILRVGDRAGDGPLGFLRKGRACQKA
jgi:hypothetical protein